MRKPNFFIVGAPKCGTTWLHRYLSQHPQVFVPIRKEPHFFNTDSSFRWFHSIEDYERLFADAPADAVAIGEASVWYLHSAVAVANILRYQPDARFIAMVRNPVEMAPSLHRQALYTQDETVADFDRAWNLQEARARGEQVPAYCREPSILQYRSACSLGGQVSRLLATAGAGRVQVIVHDDLRADPRAVFRAATDFLGLQPWQPERFDEVNAAKVRRSPWLKRRVRDLGQLKAKLGFKHSFGLLRSVNLWNKAVPDAIAQPSAAVVEAMRRDFAPDIALLSRTLGRSFEHWLETGVGVDPGMRTA